MADFDRQTPDLPTLDNPLTPPPHPPPTTLGLPSGKETHRMPMLISLVSSPAYPLLSLIRRAHGAEVIAKLLKYLPDSYQPIS